MGSSKRRTKKKGTADGSPAERHAVDELGRKLREAQLQLGMSRRLARVDTLDEILHELVEATVEELGAERGSVFLDDPATGELYSRVAMGELAREIRFPSNEGIAGAVFHSTIGEIVPDAYADARFNPRVDEQTEFRTSNMLCVPVRTLRGEVIGVVQVLNKEEGEFDQRDLELLEAMTTQASISLQSTQFIERMRETRERELEFLEVVADVTSELGLGALLSRVMAEATRMLSAERATLFLNDDKTGELFSRLAVGDDVGEIRFPNSAGIAGAVFSTGESVNIPYAYADLRFNPSFDRQTGFFTRSILCVPVVNKEGKVIGATQVLNKRGGPFTKEDESRLKAFTAQVSIALENAKLFDDVQNIKNYNEGMLESMSNGVITLDEEGRIVTCNKAGLEIVGRHLEAILHMPAEEFFSGANDWLLAKISRVEETHAGELVMDGELRFDDRSLSVNANILPLANTDQKKLGTMIMIEDISSEKRMKATMSRYMDPALADQLLEGGQNLLGGQSVEVTVLFSDVRGFTTLTEALGAQGTVALLNEYFTIMVDCIGAEEGMLDKFIGDAMMAGFGLPVPHQDDEDRAVRTSIEMMRELWAWNQTRAGRGELPIDIGIGLHTGSVVSGNIGSPRRMDFTMIGDGVNLAARLESACKQYGANILISEETRKGLKGTYRLRSVDRVVVKGKTKAVGVYEVLDYHTDETFPNVMDNVSYFNEGTRLYRDGNWDKAIMNFEMALKANEGDRLSRIYIERCEHLKSTPPQGEWDGVWVMQTK